MERREARRLQGRGGKRRTQKTAKTLTIFFHFILRFWYHVLTCNWPAPRDSARSILERAGCNQQWACSLPPITRRAQPGPALPVRRGEVLLLLKAFLQAHQLQLGEHGAAPTPLLGLAPGSQRLAPPASSRSCSSSGRCGAPAAPGSPGPAASSAEPSPEQPSGASGNLNTAACSAFSTAAGREWGAG